MATAPEPVRTTKQTTLERTLTTALNELDAESALVGLFDRADGPLTLHALRGFTPREAQAVLRALPAHDLGGSNGPAAGMESDGQQAIRLRVITPAARSVTALPLRYRNRAYGVLVIGRKEGAGFSKKDRASAESTGEEITAALERAGLFDGSVLLARPFVTQEPVSRPEPAPVETAPPVASYATPAMQEQVVAALAEAQQAIAFDRAWVCIYDPVAGVVEVVGISGELKTDQKSDHRRDLKLGQRLPLDSSASGWAVRHRKPRVDQDLASTQGRFLDHKPIYKDHYQCALAVPFFVRGQVGGTITVASKTPLQYGVADARLLEPIILKLTESLQPPSLERAPSAESGHEPAGAPALPPTAPLEPLIRKQERHAAIGEFSSWLAAEVREPLGAARAQLVEVTGEGALDFDTQTRIEGATRDLMRVESVLNEILDFAKPLELNRRPCRIPEVIENALTLVATDLDVNRIRVTKDYAAHLAPVRCDDAKMQQVFVSIIKNAIEAMSPGGHLHLEVGQPRQGRGQAQITIKNDGVPIPTEHVGKVFEPFFSTKRSGTGLGLATVKKIIEEHQGHISIASGPGQGTAVIIQLPLSGPRRVPFRRRGRGRRPHRGR